MVYEPESDMQVYAADRKKVEDIVLSILQNNMGLSDSIYQELVVGLAGITFHPDSRMGNREQYVRRTLIYCIELTSPKFLPGYMTSHVRR
jgi:hypothetical protein